MTENTVIECSKQWNVTLLIKNSSSVFFYSWIHSIVNSNSFLVVVYVLFSLLVFCCCFSFCITPWVVVLHYRFSEYNMNELISYYELNQNTVQQRLLKSKNQIPMTDGLTTSTERHQDISVINNKYKTHHTNY